MQSFLYVTPINVDNSAFQVLLLYIQGSDNMPDYLYSSLYFTTSRLYRNVNRLAEEEFKKIDIPPSYGMLLLLLEEWKELTPTAISNHLDVKPSTTTRFLDKLQKKKLISRRSEGRYTYVSLSKTGLLKIREVQGTLETLELKLKKIVTTTVATKQKKILTQMGDAFHDED